MDVFLDRDRHRIERLRQVVEFVFPLHPKPVIQIPRPELARSPRQFRERFRQAPAQKDAHHHREHKHQKTDRDQYPDPVQHVFPLLRRIVLDVERHGLNVGTVA